MFAAYLIFRSIIIYVTTCNNLTGDINSAECYVVMLYTILLHHSNLKE